MRFFGLGQLGTHSPIKTMLTRPVVRLDSHVNELPGISVVVPSFNQSAFISETLDSLLAEQYPKLEILVIDGGSDDGTVDILQEYGQKLTWWVSEPDSGQANAINKGFSKATGEILAWLNSDDMITPGALWRIADYFEKNPATEVVYGDRILVDQASQEIGRWILPDHCDKALRWFDPVPQETLYWRRRAWECVGSQLDESLEFALDWDLLLRFSRAGLRIVHLPIFLGMFRVHVAQKTQSQIESRGFREMTRLRRETLGFEPSRTEVRCHLVGYLLRAKWRELLWTLRGRLP